MDSKEIEQRLSQITTAWTILAQAHHGSAQAMDDARARLLRRYGTAIYRYLLGALRDTDRADELFQEFALRFVRGDFHKADPARGRFRDFLKTALFHLIVDDQRRRKKQPESLGSSILREPFVVEEQPLEEAERKFLSVWRGELMAKAWETLADHERTTGQPLYQVLRYRIDNPDIPSGAMAETFSERLGKPVTSGWIRKKLFQAREKFTDALLDEVAHSLESPDRDDIERELIDLELLEHCRAALDRRKPPLA